MEVLSKFMLKMFPISRGNPARYLRKCCIRNISQAINENLRMDICTTEKDREEFYKTAGDAFYKSTISIRHLPDENKRELFLPAYFKYLHEESLLAGKSVLPALKKREIINGEEVWRTVYSGVYTYDTTPPDKLDDSEIRDLYKEGADAMKKRDTWKEETIDGPLRELANEIGSAAWLLARQVTTPEYKNQQYGLKYGRLGVKIAYEIGLKRHSESNNKEPFKIPPFDYIAFSDTFPGAFRLMEKIGRLSAGHFHYNYKPGLMCYFDSKEILSPDKYSCYFIMVDKNICSELKNALNERFDGDL